MLIWGCPADPGLPAPISKVEEAWRPGAGPWGSWSSEKQLPLVPSEQAPQRRVDCCFLRGLGTSLPEFGAGAPSCPFPHLTSLSRDTFGPGGLEQSMLPILHLKLEPSF